VDTLFPTQAPDPEPTGVVAIGDDAWIIRGWLLPDEQLSLADECDRWAEPPAGAIHTTLPSGGVMSVRTVCLGWHWIPYRYVTHTADGTPVKPMPKLLRELGARAVEAVGYERAEGYDPDVGLVNFYDATAKMGLHQDKDERVWEPIVSLSLGASAMFRLGNTENRNRPWTDTTLHGGDLVVFGGRSRLAYHGITKVLPNTGPWQTTRPGQRINITLRMSGLTPNQAT
jgi:DNA oxidative demethylase